MNRNLSERFTQFLSDLRYQDLPASTVEYTKLLVLDYFASAAAGYKVNQATNRALQSVFGAIQGAEQSPVLFDSRRYPAEHADFLNAAYTHGADMDDGHRVLGGHPGGPVISAALAAASTAGTLTGEELILAIVCGYEAMIRIGAAIQPGHLERGFHSTGTTGTIGAAVAACKLRGVSEDTLFRAFSLATVQASGLMSVTESGQSAKPLNSARAAYTGMLCAALAQAGVAAPVNPLESPKGFFHAFGGESLRPEAITDALGQRFEINGCYIKPYPTCRATHPGAEAALILREQIPDLRQIREIRLFIYPRAIFIAGDKANHVPQEAEQCKFSIAYALACVLHHANIRVDEDIIRFTPQRAQEVLEICRKVQLIPDPSTEDVLAGKRGCRVEIDLQDGRTLRQTIILPKGDPEVPMSFDDVRAKLAACADGLMTPQAQDRLYQAVTSLERQKPYQDLVAEINRT